MEIDYNQLTRDYDNTPLGRYEIICKEDLEYLYIKCNLPKSDIKKIIHKSEEYISKRIKEYNLVKTAEQKKLERELMVQRVKDTSLQKYGVPNVMKNKEIQDKLKSTMLHKYGVDNIQKKEEIKDKTKQTCMQKYGVDNVAKSSKVKNKTKQTCQEKYNADSPLHSKEIKEKIKQTMIEKYGVEYALQSPYCLEKAKQTCLNKYGVDNPAQSEGVKQKTKLTNIKRYGYSNYMKTEEGKSKLKQSLKITYIQHKDEIIDKYKTTCLQKYNCENVSQNEQIKEKKKLTTQQNFGVDNAMQCPEILNKAKQTNLEKYGDWSLGKNSSIYESKVKQGLIDKYGVDNPMKDENIAKKVGETHKENKPIYIQKSLQKYGKEWPCQTLKIRDKISKGVIESLPKVYATKRINGTFVTSKPEEEIYKLLLQKYSEVKRQYHSKEYPFCCDFYIPSQDLYIEINFHWTHGWQPFDSSNPEHIRELQIWKNKAKSSNFYQNAIEVWTISDVKKREIAKENNLNYLEFYNWNEFKIWSDSKSNILLK